MSERLSLTCHGHAAFSIETKAGVLLIDPHEPDLFGGLMDYPKITAAVDAVVCTHDHLDHCAVEGLVGEAQLLDSSVSAWRGGAIERYKADHDEYGGRRRGGQVDVLRLRYEDWSIVHLSDVGQSPDPGWMEALYRPDLCIVPVGGFYTMGAAQAWSWCMRMAPRCIVPMHFGTPYCKLPLLSPDVFLSYVRGDVSYMGAHWHSICRESLPFCAMMTVE